MTSPTATPVCTTLPVATATLSASGTVSGITLTGAVGCNGPEKPVLTIAAPTVSTCSGTGDVKKCIANVCTGDIPSNATYCENDTTIA
ncbi:hypothetical protein H6768_03825 [Candidatus Peribacteria bacterium]|nr:hypothetical protein [Candidatus Peribacteria bacterium]